MTIFTLARPAAALKCAAAVHLQRCGPLIEQVSAALAAALLITMAALPQERELEPARTAAGVQGAFAGAPGRESTFGAYLGAPYHYPSDFHFTKQGVHDFNIRKVEWYTHPFENPLYYGARIQRWSAGGVFGAMLDFTHSKAYAPLDKPASLDGTFEGKPLPPGDESPEKPSLMPPRKIFNKLEFTHGHNMLTLNGLMRFARFSNVLIPYAGIGAGVSLPHSEMQLQADGDKRTYEYQYAGPCAQALLGLELRLRTGSVFLEYKFTIADYRAPHTLRDGSLFPIDIWHQLKRWRSGAEPPGGWGETRLTSHQAIGGFLVRFVPDVATPGLR